MLSADEALDKEKSSRCAGRSAPSHDVGGVFSSWTELLPVSVGGLRTKGFLKGGIALIGGFFY